MQGLYELTGAEVVHAYGATETSPLVTLNRFKPSVRESMSDEQLFELKRKQGLPVSGVDIVIIDGIGNIAPHDGNSQGEICVRGPWITTSYNAMSEDELEGRFIDGYWRSGDVGTIDEHGYLKVTDRIKDVIKSGGEWISSIDMENLLLSHEDDRGRRRRGALPSEMAGAALRARLCRSPDRRSSWNRCTPTCRRRSPTGSFPRRSKSSKRSRVPRSANSTRSASAPNTRTTTTTEPPTVGVRTDHNHDERSTPRRRGDAGTLSQVEDHGAVRVLTLDRPKALNAL